MCDRCSVQPSSTLAPHVDTVQTPSFKPAIPGRLFHLFEHNLLRLALGTSLLGIKSACSPSIHCSSSYEFHSVLCLGVCCAKAFSQRRLRRAVHNEGPVRRYAAQQRGMSVRSLRTGQRIHITQSPVSALSTPDHPGLNVLATAHFGINNLPKQAKDSIAQLLGQAPRLLAGLLGELQASSGGSSGLNGLHAHLGAQSAGSPSIYCSSSYGIDSKLSSASTSSTPLPLDHSAALVQAQAIGYANVCELLEAQLPWRPLLSSDAAASTLQSTPSAPGAQTALVVGPSGAESDTSAGDVYTDKLGRIRIRLLWQGQLADADGSTSGSATCWVRVAQRSAGGGAGAGMGLQFIPRVGQEVLVQFLGGDINRPIVVGALYNGQGEGGLRPSPAGAQAKEASSDKDSQDNNPFASSSDTRAAAQANLMAAGTGGKSPAWFGSAHGKHGQSESGVSAGGQANAAAQWGIRTKEWGNTGVDPFSRTPYRSETRSPRCPIPKRRTQRNFASR
jgi:type VI secretion system secreted protein VgrG